MQESSVGSRSRAAQPSLPNPPGGREGVLVQRWAGHVVAVSKDRLPCSSVRLGGGEEGSSGVRASGRPASRAQGRQRVQREEGQGVEDGVREGVRGVGASQRRLSPPLASWAGCRGRQGSSGKGS